MDGVGGATRPLPSHAPLVAVVVAAVAVVVGVATSGGNGFVPESLLHVGARLPAARVPGNNPILQFFGHELEAFDAGCRKIMHKFGEALPHGSVRVRIRATNGRETRQTTESELGTALGDEQTGFVMIDLHGHPIKCPLAYAHTHTHTVACICAMWGQATTEV